ncbi:hypothetical protein [Streptomyces sp. NBC_01198]|uniref:hypothetical protein n=1 Tax=Streptomyces sp. NBC_01198 TaxID=2903769 RepID=UPI002E134B07|nr:hypothetical protein OG702_22140 [Streptomyces sp. NBC_01198]
MASRVLSLRIDADLWDRIRERAAKRGMTAQDYVVTTLVRDDFDERFTAAVEETRRFYDRRPDGTDRDQDPDEAPVPVPVPHHVPPYSSPSAGIR